MNQTCILRVLPVNQWFAHHQSVVSSRAHNSRHAGFCNPFGSQGCHRPTLFWGQDDFQTPHPTSWWSQSGLWFSSKSERAVNVAIFVVIWALRYTRHFQLLSNHWWRGSTLEKFGPFLHIQVRKFDFSFIIHPYTCASRFLRDFVTQAFRSDIHSSQLS